MLMHTARGSRPKGRRMGSERRRELEETLEDMRRELADSREDLARARQEIAELTDQLLRATGTHGRPCGRRGRSRDAEHLAARVAVLESRLRATSVDDGDPDHDPTILPAQLEAVRRQLADAQQREERTCWPDRSRRADRRRRRSPSRRPRRDRRPSAAARSRTCGDHTDATKLDAMRWSRRSLGSTCSKPTSHKPPSPTNGPPPTSRTQLSSITALTERVDSRRSHAKRSWRSGSQTAEQ